MSIYKNKSGFSLVEIIIVLSIVAILLGISLPIYNDFRRSNDINLATNSVVNALRFTQLRSVAINEDSSWSVKVSEDIIVFKGNNYVERNASFDKIFNLPNGVNISGVLETHFAKFSGLPDITGDIILTNQNVSKTISINQKGMVDY